MKLIKCRICNKIFKHKDNLKQHIYRKHKVKISNQSNVGPFNCNVCEETFSDENEIQDHNEGYDHKIKKITSVMESSITNKKDK